MKMKQLLIIGLSVFSCLTQAMELVVTEQKRLLAREIALRSEHLELSALVERNQLVIPSQKLKTLSPSIDNIVAEKNALIARIKDYEPGASLIQLRLAKPGMLDTLEAGLTPLFAYEPAGSDKLWQQIEAFDHLGKSHFLDAKVIPRRPVF